MNTSKNCHFVTSYTPRIVLSRFEALKLGTDLEVISLSLIALINLSEGGHNE